MNLINFFKQFPTDKSCEQYITKQTFEHGQFCFKCNHDKIYKIKTQALKQKYKCSKCHYRFNITTNTIFEGSKLSLQKWFLAMYLMKRSSKGVSSLQLSKYADMTQKTAWLTLTKLRQSLHDNNLNKLKGSVEIDETYIGGIEKNKHQNKRLKGSQGGKNKAVIIGAITRETKKIQAHLPNTQLKTVKNFVLNNVSNESKIYTDETL